MAKIDREIQAARIKLAAIDAEYVRNRAAVAAGTWDMADGMAHAHRLARVTLDRWERRARGNHVGEVKP